jgi:hypothetical protein
MGYLEDYKPRPETLRQGTRAVGAGAAAGALFGALLGAASGAIAGAFLWSATTMSKEAIRRYRERQRAEEEEYDEEM